MSKYICVDDSLCKRKEDCFALVKRGNGSYRLSIAVARNQPFYKQYDTVECIILEINFTKKGELENYHFSNNQVKIHFCYNFTEYDTYLESIIGSSKYYFLHSLIERASHIQSTQLDKDNSEHLIEGLMSIFTYYAKKKYKICCKNFKRAFSPKDRLYRKQLARAISDRKKQKRFRHSRELAA